MVKEIRITAWTIEVHNHEGAIEYVWPDGGSSKTTFYYTNKEALDKALEARNTYRNQRPYILE